MAGEDRGVYVMVNGTLEPAATVPGAQGVPGAKGDKGDPGPQGLAAAGVVVSVAPPANPATDTVWIDKS